jgi:hypothetical protein
MAEKIFRYCGGKGVILSLIDTWLRWDVRRPGEERAEAVPITYILDLEKRIIFTTAEGLVNLEEYRSYVERRKLDALYDPTMAGILDARNARFVFKPTETKELVRIAKEELPEKRIRRAIVVSRDFEFGISRMFEMLVSDARLEYGVFRDYATALAWVENADGRREERHAS